MSDAVAADRKATHEEVLAHADALRQLALALGLTGLRVREDGAVVIHSNEPGYQVANRLSLDASRAIGAYVHVITDDVPGAVSARPL